MSSWGEKVSRLLGGIASQLGTNLERPPASSPDAAPGTSPGERP
jgi:hypothetical protein